LASSLRRTGNSESIQGVRVWLWVLAGVGVSRQGTSIGANRSLSANPLIVREKIGPFCRRERNGDETVDIVHIVNPMQINCEDQ